MNLISFDIGIRNMAYCVFDISKSTFCIQEWGILNLMDPVAEMSRCTCPKKKEVIAKKKRVKVDLQNHIVQEMTPTVLCQKIAKYEKNGEFYCDKHAKNLGLLLPTKEISPPALRKLSREELIALGKRFSLFLDNEPKTKRMGLESLIVYFQEHCLKPVKTKKTKTATEVDLITIGRNMRKCLDTAHKNLGQAPTHIIMENQISPLAGRMKTIQGMLAQYYIMRDAPSIEFISSANKLKGLVQDDVVNKKETKDEETDRIKYKKHKSDGVAICRRFLAENPDLESWTPLMEKGSKLDDLADCFLQGIWYLKRTNKILYADNLKINIV